jgi:hypothetical protein
VELLLIGQKAALEIDNVLKAEGAYMGKTYRLLEHVEPLHIDEIRRLYEGYWVYLVKATFGEFGELLSGVPVVIGSMAADGAEDGIYEMFKAEEYDVRADLNLLPNKGFISSLRIVGASV